VSQSIHGTAAGLSLETIMTDPVTRKTLEDDDYQTRGDEP
jgi:hypothetical protein